MSSAYSWEHLALVGLMIYLFPLLLRAVPWFKQAAWASGQTADLNHGFDHHQLLPQHCANPAFGNLQGLCHSSALTQHPARPYCHCPSTSGTTSPKCTLWATALPETFNGTAPEPAHPLLLGLRVGCAAGLLGNSCFSLIKILFPGLREFPVSKRGLPSPSPFLWVPWNHTY